MDIVRSLSMWKAAWKKARLSVLLTAVLSAGLFLYVKHSLHQDAIRAALAFADFESAAQIDVAVEGSIFTREYEVAFQASEEDIKTWLIDSPGTAFSRRDSQTEGTITYKISEPNALFAQVTVDWETLTVLIHTYWS